MASPPPSCTLLEQFQVSPPPATVGNRSLPLTFFDFHWLLSPPVHTLFFYELPITKTYFTQTIVPNLTNSLSITLQHFFPFAGNLIVFPTTTKKPEIRYVEGDSVVVTSAECNLDFKNLTGNHPRECDKFYPLIPLLKRTAKISDFITIPVFSVQVTLFPHCGFSIGITSHHILADARTLFMFLKAWTSITGSGTDELFLANGTLPIYDRLILYPELDEVYLRKARVEGFNQDYQPQSLSGPTDKVRATFILTPTAITQLKKFVSTQLPKIAYVSSFSVACAYIWSCIAESRDDELEVLGIFVDCRERMDPPIPVGYFGNCLAPCRTIAKTATLKGREGFLTAAKLLGENLHKILTDKDVAMKDISTLEDMFPGQMPTAKIAVSGTPKLRFYDMDFGWGKPKKYETISIDYSGSISMYSCKESNENLEIGVCLSATEMKVFYRIFNHGLVVYPPNATGHNLTFSKF